MAGFIRVPVTREHNGRMKFYNATSTAKVANGALLVIKDATNLQYLTAADTGFKARCIDIIDMMGKKGYVFRIEAIGDNELYFVDNQDYFFDHLADINMADVSVGVGEFVNAKKLVVDEEIVTDQVTGTIAVGTVYGAKTDGTIG